MIAVRYLLALLVALQTCVAGGRAHGVTCAGMAGSDAAHVHAHQLLDLLEAEDGEESGHDQHHDAVEVTALLAAQSSASPADVEAPACLTAALVVTQPAQPAPHLLGLPPATAGPPRQPLYLTFCSFRN